MAASQGVWKVHKLHLDKVMLGRKDRKKEGMPTSNMHTHAHTQLESFLLSTDKVQGIVEACSFSDNLASYPGSS